MHTYSGAPLSFILCPSVWPIYLHFRFFSPWFEVSQAKKFYANLYSKYYWTIWIEGFCANNYSPKAGVFKMLWVLLSKFRIYGVIQILHLIWITSVLVVFTFATIVKRSSSNRVDSLLQITISSIIFHEFFAALIFCQHNGLLNSI